MDTKSQAADRVYEDFEPYYEWVRDEEGIIMVMLTGFRRDQLKVQVTSKPVLKIKGERQTTGNIWRRFDIEFPVPADYDTDNVTAKFVGGKLVVKFGKLVKPKETTNPPQEAPPSQKGAQEGTPETKEARTNNEVSDQKTPPKDNEPSYEKGKSKTETAASIGKEALNKVKTTEANEAATSKALETKDAKPITRSKTRLLDFTLSLRPSNQVDNEAHGNMDPQLNKRKRLVKGVVLILLVVGLGLYIRNAFGSSHEGSKFQEL